MTPYQQLVALVNRACPDRLVLKFGCEVRGTEAVPILTYVGKSNGQHCLAFNDGLDKLLFVDDIETEILGPPLTLADVLRAIDEMEKCYTYITSNGDLHAEDENGIDYLLATLDLATPPSEWPDDVVKTVISLIDDPKTQ